MSPQGRGCVHLGVENIHKVGAIGKAGFGWEVKIVDDARGLVKEGEVGELGVKGLRSYEVLTLTTKKPQEKHFMTDGL